MTTYSIIRASRRPIARYNQVVIQIQLFILLILYYIINLTKKLLNVITTFLHVITLKYFKHSI